jgi:hypothetical protein
LLEKCVRDCSNGTVASDWVIAIFHFDLPYVIAIREFYSASMAQDSKADVGHPI